MSADVHFINTNRSPGLPNDRLRLLKINNWSYFKIWDKLSSGKSAPSDNLHNRMIVYVWCEFRIRDYCMC